jgi:hypothetical protein
MTRGTIQTTFHGKQRVSFSCPPDGYCIDDLDALLVAIHHARPKLLEQVPDDAPATLPVFDLTAAFDQQQSRMAAPS